ncbi:hypothetical protein SGRIM128S_02405 [Streptomyces griseomycini]
MTRHRDGTATTADFVRLASAVAGRDLTGFLNPWLYGASVPDTALRGPAPCPWAGGGPSSSMDH